MKSRHRFSSTDRLYRDLARESCSHEPGAARAAGTGGQCELFVTAAAGQQPGGRVTEALADILAPAPCAVDGIAAGERRFRGFGRPAQLALHALSYFASHQIF